MALGFVRSLDSALLRPPRNPPRRGRRAVRVDALGRGRGQRLRDRRTEELSPQRAIDKRVCRRRHTVDAANEAAFSFTARFSPPFTPAHLHAAGMPRPRLLLSHCIESSWVNSVRQLCSHMAITSNPRTCVRAPGSRSLRAAHSGAVCWGSGHGTIVVYAGRVHRLKVLFAKSDTRESLSTTEYY